MIYQVLGIGQLHGVTPLEPKMFMLIATILDKPQVHLVQLLAQYYQSMQRMVNIPSVIYI